MPLYLDTRGKSNCAVGICARCKTKYALVDLRPDPNAPGLLCCPDGCLDVLDPYRLPARTLERISVDNPRPDESVALTYSGAVPVPLYTNPLFQIDRIGAARPWQKNTLYRAGDSITPLSVDLDTTPLPQNWWMCVLQGTSGAVPPVWPTEPGVLLGDYIVLTSDIQSVIGLLDNLGILQLQNETQSNDLIADGTNGVPSIASGLQLLSDHGLTLFKDSNGDGTVCWLNLGFFPL